MHPDPLTSLEAALGYRFQSPSKALQALRHRSYVNESLSPALPDNERLEFLGDAVLNLVVGHLLMERFPQMREGDLSRTRAHLVSEPRLAGLARRVGLGDLLQLGRGEERSGGRGKDSLLSDAFEAVVAAVFLDGGYARTFDLVTRHFEVMVEAVDPGGAAADFKSRLQEMAQNHRQPVPTYRIVSESGPDHDKTFWVELTLDSLTARGTGKSRKAAEQDAARNALQQLDPDA